MSGPRRAVTGIILAGGSSRRMGQNKAELDLGGVPVLQRVASTVSRVSDEVIIAAGRNLRQQLPADVSARWVGDPPGGAGPLAGLVAGLAAARHDAAIVVAADMPFLNEDLLAYLLEALEGHDVVVPVIGGREQPLHAAYSRNALTTAQSLLQSGVVSMKEVLGQLQVRYVPEDICLGLDPAGLSCFNMNTPTDLAFAREKLAALAARAVPA